MPYRQRYRIKLLVVSSFVTVMVILFMSPEAHTQSAQKLKSQDDIIREQMIDISKQLNVTCTECHKVENFKDSSKANFRTAKDHIRIVELLRSNGFDGKSNPVATCYMCHRGELSPAYREGM